VTRNRTSLVFLLSLTAVTLCFGLVIMRPFLKPILFALALAMVFHPLHGWVRKWIRKENAAALISTFLAFLAMIAPALVLGRAITSELTELYQTLNGEGPEGRTLALSWLDRGEQWTNEVVHQAGLSTFDIRSAIRQHIGQGSGWLLQQAAGFLGDLTGVLLGAVVTAITLFFLFREGASLRERVASIVPLAADHLERLFSGVHEVVVASVYGILAIGLLQGILVGFSFWVLGLPSPVLWGLVTSFFSLIPIVGAGGVWIPAVIILMTSGHWVKALILVAWGAGIVHPVDNILRPYLVGQRAKLSAIYLFFAILGGVKAFGLIGLLLGPVVLSVTLVLLAILKNELKEWTSPLNARHEGSLIGSVPLAGADTR
jgi:predicted PurR-regulated permease PerM